MKSVNEQMAEVMGWEKIGSMIYIKSENRYVAIEFLKDIFLNEVPAAKLLQQRLVDDGWEVVIRILNKNYCAAAMMWESKDTEEYPHLIATHSIDCAETEPAALVDLFCKCNGIKEE